MRRTPKKFLRVAVLGLLLSGCAALIATHLDDLYGNAHVRDRAVALDSSWGTRFNNEIQPLLEKRCVVCHACYDAPCQLQLSSPAGIERGLSKELVYQGTRLTQTQPSRLSDALSIEAWRARQFHPVLNERDQNETANRQAGLLYRTLELKRRNPLPAQALLSKDFSLGLDHAQQCSTIEEFDALEKNQPLWGMPYGLSELAPDEFTALADWIAAGAPMPKATALPTAYGERVARWEALLNRDDIKSQLINRYIYEHLFLGHFYFDDLPVTYFFSLVRSSTPPGVDIQQIPTRRPYDEPGVARVYYRLQPLRESLLSKTHMPYALGEKRWQNWHQWFFDAPFEVTTLPSYKIDVASNPFIAFEQLPAQSRYRFMLDHAHFTINGFIKGPVCRGQVALNVINDRFWVFFVRPGLPSRQDAARFLAQQSRHLTLPAESAGSILPIASWLQYSQNQKAYLKAKYEVADSILSDKRKLSLGLIWDGDGANPNAALTVFRHFDSATVIQGLVGKPPKTAWVIDYPILERIHYLLVAGFDVYGNVGHHLLTRLYMDFLRMESEFNFLMLLPRDEQEKEWDDWYTDAPWQVRDYAKNNRQYFDHDTDIVYKTATPKLELYKLLAQYLKPVLSNNFDLRHRDVPPNHRLWLTQLDSVTGIPASILPQTSVLTVEGNDDATRLYTVLHNNGHSNISSLLNEESTRRPERDTLTVVRGLLGAYPGAYWNVRETDLARFVKDLAALRSENDYATFMRRYGIRRTDRRFWTHSDNVHALYQKQAPLEYGLLDYNRLENR